MGPAGTAGPTGVAGPTGANGAAGTANVIYSPWVSFPASSTTAAPYLYNFTVTQITQDLLEKGVVLSFVRIAGTAGPTSETFPLPYIFPSGTTASNSEIYASYIVGNIKIRSTISISGVGFRYIIIPGGIAAGRQAAVDYTDYEAVKKYYNLPD